MSGVFSNVESIANFHAVFFAELTKTAPHPTSVLAVATAFLRLADFLKMYSAYVNNYELAMRTLAKLNSTCAVLCPCALPLTHRCCVLQITRSSMARVSSVLCSPSAQLCTSRCVGQPIDCGVVWCDVCVAFMAERRASAVPPRNLDLMSYLILPVQR